MKKYNRPLIYLIIIFLVAGLLIFIKAKNSNSLKTLSKKPTISSESSSKNYTSKTLKLTISVPEKFEVQEKFTSIFIKDNSGYLITLSRTGTNYNYLRDYLENLIRINHLDLLDKKELLINGLEAMVITQPDPNNKILKLKSYYIFSNNSVYTLSTSSEALYSDLDQIAKSFKYTP